MDMTTYAVLLHKIKGVMSGVKNVRLIEPRTLEFEAQDGQKYPITLPTPDIVWVGDDAPTDPTYELWIDTSDQGTTPIGKAILSDKIVSGVSIGSVVPGTTFNVGDSLEDVIRAMLTVRLAPKLNIGIAPGTTIYDIVEDKLETLTITANVTKGSSDIQKVRYFIDGQVVQVVEEGVASGGVIKYTYNFPVPKNTTFIVKADATDIEGLTGSSQTTISFVGKTYYGTVVENTEITEEVIKSLDSTLKKDLGYNYTDISTTGFDLYHIVLCYPTSFGKITSVKDGLDWEYIQDYTVKDITIDGLNYTLMYLTNPVSVTNFMQKFK